MLKKNSRNFLIAITKPLQHAKVWLSQCDQIWQNLATLAKYSSLGHFCEGLFSIWQNFEQWKILGKFSSM